jgi:hypothetical protein
MYVDGLYDVPDADGYVDTEILREQAKITDAADSTPDQSTGHIGDVIADHDTPSYVPTSDAMAFGEINGFPDARALQGWRWREHHLPETAEVANLPGYPHLVVRAENPICVTDEAYRDLAAKGMRHFAHMAENGIAVPAQKFVIAPDLRGKPHNTLYAITERIDGRVMTLSQADRKWAEPIIDGSAEYLLWAYEDPHENDILIHRSSPQQYTITGSDTTVLHDVGLDFSRDLSTYNGEFTFGISAGTLGAWVRQAGLNKPERLARLEQIVTEIDRRRDELSEGY